MKQTEIKSAIYSHLNFLFRDIAECPIGTELVYLTAKERPLHIRILHACVHEDQFYQLIAVSRFEPNGDQLIGAPDIEARVNHTRCVVDGRSYQKGTTYRSAYDDHGQAVPGESAFIDSLLCLLLAGVKNAGYRMITAMDYALEQGVIVPQPGRGTGVYHGHV